MSQYYMCRSLIITDLYMFALGLANLVILINGFRLFNKYHQTGIILKIIQLSLVIPLTIGIVAVIYYFVMY